MNATHDRVKSIFLTAAELASSEERRAFVDSQCAGDDSLRAEVNELLRHQQSLGSFLELPVVAVELDHAAMFEEPLAERPGTVIGPYKLLEQIGEGGMGVVFMAEQSEPIRRKIALKIIKPGMDTREVITRFEAEQQALAMMDHPNIAKVLAAGATETGRPYFVMELVQGVPITEYCDQCNLTTNERLELFVLVCQAVQHAHQKGVIHRDIKPTNVLVAMQDGRPAPKIIDFGVAKAIDQRLTEHTVTTAFAQMVGTPLYMSPEQAELSPLGVDTRSDIYSLGVLLYELLTGATPFDKDRVHAAPYDELRRIIREEEPPRPSARISTLAADLSATIAEHRRTDGRRLEQTVRGELDWIVMKCLDKDRNRRYESAAALAADVVHHLNDEPIAAVAPSRAYRATKFVRRNKWPVIAATAVLMGLVAGMIGTTIALVSQSRQRSTAERERAEAQLNLAGALHSQLKYADAEKFYRKSLETTGDATPEDRQRAARTLLDLGLAVRDGGEAERLQREALTAYRAAFPPDDPNIAYALTTIGIQMRAAKRYAEAEPFWREAYDINHRAKPVDHNAIGMSAAYLGNVLFSLGRHAESEPLFRESIAEYRLADPPDQWAAAMAQMEYAKTLVVLRRFPEAESQLLDALRVLQPTDTYYSTVAMISLYTAWDEAEPGTGRDALAREWTQKFLTNYYGTGLTKKPAAETNP